MLRKILCRLALMLLLFLPVGCVSKQIHRPKLQDLEYTIIMEEKVPHELLTIIQRKKMRPFRLSYADQGVWYLARGYGAQGKTGYRVTVEELYETDSYVCLRTTLWGPEKREKTEEIETYPYVVVRFGYRDKNIVFE